MTQLGAAEDFLVARWRLLVTEFGLTADATDNIMQLAWCFGGRTYDAQGQPAFDNQGNIVSWNKQLSRLTGIEQLEAVGKSIDRLETPWRDLLAARGYRTLPLLPQGFGGPHDPAWRHVTADGWLRDVAAAHDAARRAGDRRGHRPARPGRAARDRPPRRHPLHRPPRP